MVAKMEIDTPSNRQHQLMQKHFSQLVEQILQVRMISLSLSHSFSPSLSHFLSPPPPSRPWSSRSISCNVRYDVDLPDDDEIQVHVHTYIHTYMYIHVYVHLYSVCLYIHGTKLQKSVSGNQFGHYEGIPLSNNLISCLSLYTIRRPFYMTLWDDFSHGRDINTPGRPLSCGTLLTTDERKSGVRWVINFIYLHGARTRF
jgi:hypothetical protein